MYSGLLVAVGVLLSVAFLVQTLYLLLALRGMRKVANAAAAQHGDGAARLPLHRRDGLEPGRHQRQGHADLGQQRHHADAELAHQHQLEDLAWRAAGGLRVHLCARAGAAVLRSRRPC